MASVPKGLAKRPTLRLPHAAAPNTAPGATTAPQQPVGRSAAGNDGLRELLGASLWPMVASAFRDVDDHVEVRFFQLGELQVVISRGPVRGQAGHSDLRTVTLEVWPSAGPRLLVVEWSGSRPYVVHRRDGDWLPRLIRASRRFE